MSIFLLASFFSSLLPLGKGVGFLESFSQWDGQWYLRILKEGYWYKGPNIQSPVAFFPLLPLLGKPLTFLGFSPEFSLFLMANLSCLGFFIFFWLLTKNDFGEKVANRALFYYAISPLSFIFSALYTESLFLFLACACFFFLRKSEFLKASLFAGLASATRPFGIFLILPVLFNAIKEKRSFSKILIYSLFSASGLILFSIFLWLKLKELTPFFGVEMKAWHHIWVPPWISFKLFADSLLTTKSSSPFYPIAFFDFLIVIIFTILLLTSPRRVSFDYQLFMWPIYMLSMAQPWDPRFFLSSGSISRYMFQLFPLVMLLGLFGKQNKKIHYFITFFFASLFGPLALAFFHGLWVE
jgi:Gpi18-like mannosyltransferase